jgi:hypothetical protein
VLHIVFVFCVCGLLATAIAFATCFAFSRRICVASVMPLRVSFRLLSLSRLDQRQFTTLETCYRTISRKLGQIVGWLPWKPWNIVVAVAVVVVVIVVVVVDLVVLIMLVKKKQ